MPLQNTPQLVLRDGCNKRKMHNLCGNAVSHYSCYHTMILLPREVKLAGSPFRKDLKIYNLISLLLLTEEGFIFLKG
jgi:hypothetical protein